MTAEERRVHARIETYLACRVYAKDKQHLARMRGLSLDGASLLAPNGMADVGDVIAIELEEHDPIGRIRAEVVRTEGGGLKLRYGVRFTIEDPRTKDALLVLMRSLTEAEGTSSRRHPRIYRYLSLTYQAAEPIDAVMSNVSKSGLGFECEAIVTVGEEIALELQLSPDHPRIEIPCIVANVRPIEPFGRRHVGVRFAVLTAEQRVELDRLIETLIDTPAT